MDPNEEISDFEVVMDDDADDSVSVDDFIRELEAKEKDLHITADLTLIEVEDTDDEGATVTSLEPFDPVAALPRVSVATSTPSENQSVFVEPSAMMNRELDELKRKVETLEDERAEMLMGLQRRAKDFDTFKARTERERTEMMQNQICDLAGRLLPVIDNLHRAIEFAGDAAGSSSDEFRHFYSGMVLVEQQVSEVLAGMGIEAIPTVGSQFDPHLHEAVATDDSGNVPPNTITAELLRGYMVGNRVIRHSMVKVAVENNDKSEAPSPDLLHSPE